MNCYGAAMSALLQGTCAHSLLLNGRPRLHQLPHCRLQRTERSSGYGLIYGHEPLRPLRCLASGNVSVEELDYEDDEGDAWLVDKVTTPFNQISVLELDDASDHELAGAYVLKLDGADLAHSMYWSNGKVWCGGCHEVFASLPPLLPESGPVAILGLGAGTVARLLLHIWPSLHLEGWELDSEVIRVARQYFALADLESPNANPKQSRLESPRAQSDANPKQSRLIQGTVVRTESPQAQNANPKQSRARKKSKGRLVVHVGDALAPEATVEGGFAGIMVDIFINGTVCKELAEVSTWRKLKQRMRPGGRIMVNCIPNSRHLQEDEGVLSRQWDELMHGVVRAMDVVFPGQVSVRELTDGNNVMLLSGEVPEPAIWSSELPDRLAQGVYEWKRWDESHALWDESHALWEESTALNPKP